MEQRNGIDFDSATRDEKNMTGHTLQASPHLYTYMKRTVKKVTFFYVIKSICICVWFSKTIYNKNYGNVIYFSSFNNSFGH